MITQKIADLYFKTNDIYILETCNNMIVINNNNQGLLILDHSLHVKKEIAIGEIAPIYFVYKSYDNNTLMLYLPDVNQIIVIDMVTNKHFTISLPEAFHEEIFSPNYYWNHDMLLLTTTNNNFYQLDFASKKLHSIASHQAQENCAPFYSFWNICKKYNVLTFYPEDTSFIFQNDKHSLGFFNYQQNQSTVIRGFTDGWHDVEYNNNIFLFIHEKKIEIIKDQDKITLKPHQGYIFLRTRFLDNNHFIALSSNPSNYQESLLEVYEIKKNKP